MPPSEHPSTADEKVGREIKNDIKNTLRVFDQVESTYFSPDFKQPQKQDEVLDGLLTISKSDFFKSPTAEPIRQVLGDWGKDPLLLLRFIDRVDAQFGDIAKMQDCLQLGLALQLESNPLIQPVLQDIAQSLDNGEFDPNPVPTKSDKPARKPTPAWKRNRVWQTAMRTVLSLGAMGVLGQTTTEATYAHTSPTIPISRDNDFARTVNPTGVVIVRPATSPIAETSKVPTSPSVKPTAQISPSVEPSATPEKQVKSFLELIQPMSQEAQKRRQAEAAKNPEYFHNVDKELNADLLNIALMGYGEEHGEDYQEMGGSFTILSINTKTGEIGTVSLSRDIRIPELEDSNQGPGRQTQVLRHLYHTKGFDGTRDVLQKATGLAVDYQVVMKDVFIRDYINDVSGPVTLTVPKDHHTSPYRLGGQDFGPDYIPAGQQTMDTQKTMTFILGEDQNPEGRQDERSYRKNLLMKALLKQIKNEVHSKNPLFGLKLTGFVLKEFSNPDIIADFDLGLMTEMAKKAITAGVTIPELNDQKQIVFHDKFFGDGGVRRVHNIENYPNQGDLPDSANITTEVADRGLPEWMLIPEGGDPYTPDTVDNYYADMRSMVKNLWSPK